MTEHLFIVGRRVRVRAELPEYVPTVVCPDCGGVLERHSTFNDALFRHGGYGATIRHDVDRCVECRWTLYRGATEIPPERTA